MKKTALFLSLLLSLSPAFAEKIILDAETPVKLILAEPVSARNHHDGDTVNLVVAEDVVSNEGKVVIRKDTPALGILTSTYQTTGINLDNGNFKGSRSLYIIPISVKATSGLSIRLTGVSSRHTESASPARLATALIAGSLFFPAVLLAKPSKPKFEQGAIVTAFTRDELFLPDGNQ